MLGATRGLLRLLPVGPRGPILGFRGSVADFDPDDPAVRATSEEPLFDVPLLALREAPAAAVMVAARGHFGARQSLNREFFREAMALEGEEALAAWLACLEAGDSMAHYALGYTLYDLGLRRRPTATFATTPRSLPAIPGTGAGSGRPRRRSARSPRRAAPTSAPSHSRRPARTRPKPGNASPPSTPLTSGPAASGPTRPMRGRWFYTQVPDVERQCRPHISVRNPQ